MDVLAQAHWNLPVTVREGARVSLEVADSSELGLVCCSRSARKAGHFCPLHRPNALPCRTKELTAPSSSDFGSWCGNICSSRKDAVFCLRAAAVVFDEASCSKEGIILRLFLASYDTARLPWKEVMSKRKGTFKQKQQTMNRN